MNFRSFITGSIFGVVVTITMLYVRDPVINWVAKLSPEPQAESATIVIPKTSPVLGRTTAELVLVEFTDFQCPYCKQFHTDVMPSIKTDWIDTGKLRFVHMDLPLDFHAAAVPSAVNARCAADQRKFWEYYDALFANSDCLVCKGPDEIAKEAGLNMTDLRICKYANRHEDEIKADTELAKSLNFTGTPTFILGRDVNGSLTGEVINGALPLDEFKKKLEAAFAKK